MIVSQRFGSSVVPLLTLLGVFVSWVFVPLKPAQSEVSPPDSLHVRIDRQIQKYHVGPVARVSDDAEFMRRASLDLIGRIPSAEEARDFFADTNKDKRTSLVNRLLANDLCNQNLAVLFDVSLMERRADKYTDAKAWREYLRKSFESNKPYNLLVREILSADGTEKDRRASSRFYLARGVETHALTREVSRMFFGRDIQCAQCHDHPLVSDYFQSDYYNLFAFLDRSFLFQSEDEKKTAFVGEKPEGEAVFASVFDPDSGSKTVLPRLPFGEGVDDEPFLPMDEAYEIKPGKNVRGVPKFSRRKQLAYLATSGVNDQFNRNIANRLWHHMMGRGLVEPVDMHSDDNPASYAQLLEILANEFRGMNYDVKAFLREIALSDAYQRVIDVPQEIDPYFSQAGVLLPELKEHLASLKKEKANLDTKSSKASSALSECRAELVGVSMKAREVLDAINKAHVASGKLAGELAKIQDELKNKREIAESLAKAKSAAEAAAGELKDDAELLLAVKTLSARSKTFQQAVATLKEKKASQQTKHAEAEKQTSIQQQELDDFREKRQALVTQTHNLESPLDAIVAEQRSVADNIIDLEHEVDEAENILGLQLKLQERSEAGELLQLVEGELNKAREIVAEQKVQVLNISSDIAMYEVSLASAQDAYQIANSELENHEQLQKTILDAAEKTEVALDSLPGDVDLVLAFEKLTNRANELSNRCGELQVSVNTKRSKVNDAKDQLIAAQKEHGQLEALISKSRKNVSDRQSQLDESRAALAEINAAIDGQWLVLQQDWSQRFLVRNLKPLTPEQLAASVVEGLGLEPRLRKTAREQWQANQKAAAEKKKTEKKKNESDNVSETSNSELADTVPDEVVRKEIDALYQQRYEKLVNTFVTLFAAAPGSPQDTFSSTVDQALFFANDQQVQSWLAPTEGSLVARLMDLENASDAATEAYVCLLCRRPIPEEVQEVSKLLSEAKDKKDAMRHLVWMLLTSMEFRFNH